MRNFIERGVSTPRSTAALATLEQSFTELLDVVLAERQTGRVSSLVVDDTSGRSIGLFLHRGLALLGEKTPITFVCPPGPGEHGRRAIATLSRSQVELLGDTPLIITEVIASGEAVGSIVRALNGVGRVPDIATLSGFLTCPETFGAEPIMARHGRLPPGDVGKVLMPHVLSYAAQDLLTSDKIYAGVIREDINSTVVRPVTQVSASTEVAAEFKAFRGEIYRLAQSLAHKLLAHKPGA